MNIIILKKDFSKINLNLNYMLIIKIKGWCSMHIECFKYFYEVANTKSISKVATNSHISQSALSQQIQKLEDTLGHKLLIRSNKGVVLTEQGKIVKKHVEIMMKTYYKMLDDLSNLDKNKKTIQIDSCWTLSTYALPCTLYKMKKKFPKHNYSLTSDFSDTIEQNVLNDIHDLGFIYGKPRDESLEFYKAATDELVLVAASSFDVPKKIKLKDLLRYPLIMLNDKLDIVSTLNERLNEIGYSCNDINILFNLDSAESVKSSVLKGHGLAFLPYLSLKTELYNKQIKLISIEDAPIYYDIYLIYKKNVCNSTSVKEFIEYFKKIGYKSFC